MTKAIKKKITTSKEQIIALAKKHNFYDLFLKFFISKKKVIGCISFCILIFVCIHGKGYTCDEAICNIEAYGPYIQFTKAGTRYNLELDKNFSHSSFRIKATNEPLTGTVKEYSGNGRLNFIAHVKNAKLEGTFKEYDGNGTLVYIANYKDGELTDSKTYYEDGTLKSDIQYNNDDFKGKRYFENGNIKYEFQINVKDNFPVFLTSYYEDGKIEEEFQVQLETSTFNNKLYYTNGTVKSERNGYIVNSKIITETAMNFWENGNLQYEELYNNDTNTRIVKKYYENGGLQSEYNFNGEKYHGPYTLYDDAGNIIEMGQYENGKKSGKIEKIKNGKKEIQSFTNGVKDGPYTETNTNNTIEKGKKVNGKKEGDYEVYYCRHDDFSYCFNHEMYPNDEYGFLLSKKGTYKNGQEIGYFIDYAIDTDGKNKPWRKCPVDTDYTDCIYY